MNQKETDTDRDEQQQRSGSSKLPFISLASGILATLFLFFSPDHVILGFFSMWLWLMFSIVGFICGLYYLFKYKRGKSLERICAILGTSICGVWLCVLIIK
ncbi:MAG: hypothetical protein ACYSWZ_08700 [Planctomycetota bacterium]|jgi:hypothetical protein